jgi:hypothetical protein
MMFAKKKANVQSVMLLSFYEPVAGFFNGHVES